MDKYWLDKYFYFSPLYRGTNTKRHNFVGHRVAFPCSSSYSYIYWARYKQYWYEIDDDAAGRMRAKLLNDNI